jgi:hypothetical protein
MWEALFDNPWLKFFLILLLVLGLFVVFAWLLKRLGAERLGLGSVGGRGRQVRLAVIEDVEISGRRRLILIRRDNVEHLLMIGGPTDLVVEPNIVRAAAQREAAPPARAPAPPGAEPSPRAAALGDGGLWPLQPEAPAPRPRIPHPAAPPAPVPEEAEGELASAPPPPPAPPRRQLRAVDPLAGLAAELSRPGDVPRAPVDPGHGTFVPREPAVPREPVRPRETAREREAPIEREGRDPIRADREPETPPVRAREPVREREEPQFEPPPVRVREPMRAREREAPREAPIEREVAQVPAPAAAPEAEFNAAADQNLADMAQRLEAALRRPAKVNEARPADGATRAMTAELAAQRAPVVAHPRAAAPAPHAPTPPAEPKPGKSVYDSLEKEMASLLGRPSGKS